MTANDAAFDHVRQEIADEYAKPYEKPWIVGFSGASQLTEITPRKIVTTMQQVIEEVRLAGHDPAEGPVSIEFLDENEIIEEVLGEGG